MRARIPFDGFYESKWSSGLDDEETQFLEQIAEEHDISTEPLQEWMWRHAQHGRGHNYIAEKFVPYFESYISELGLSVTLTFSGMDSPKYYNFETDHIYVDISYRDALVLARRVGRNALRAAAKELFTSRDGFISFYRNDPAEWGPLRGWDEYQLYALFVAAVNVIDAPDYEWGIYECMSGNGVFGDALAACFDQTDFSIEVGRLVGRKEAAEEAAEEAEEDGDGRNFPAHWTSTADYVQRYADMNKNAYQAFNSNELGGKS